jgi:hypothetical protein
LEGAAEEISEQELQKRGGISFKESKGILTKVFSKEFKTQKATVVLDRLRQTGAVQKYNVEFLGIIAKIYGMDKKEK